jgi:drug/metabolite transporter (DMT)-like permease
MRRIQIYPMLQALLAAVLFGASAPLAKLLLGEVSPIALAAFLYLGSGLGVLLFKTIQGKNTPTGEREAQIARTDWKWLAGSVFAGGVAAPILLLFSLRATPATTASLLLNFEGVATTIIAALVFKEAVNRNAIWAILCVTIASIFLSWDASGQWGFSLGALGIMGACILWGIDNNLTRNISAKDPLTIVTIKGLGAGSFSLLLTLALGYSLPPLITILGAMLLGSLSYGASIVLFILAMRGLGAARTSALFGTAPLAGVLLSFVLFRETPTLFFGIALPLMVAAALLLMREQHSHRHVHEAVIHEHSHRHDDGHHTHDHPGMIDRNLRHSHVHTHERIEHEHPHTPDIHHRHAHE